MLNEYNFFPFILDSSAIRIHIGVHTQGLPQFAITWQKTTGDWKEAVCCDRRTGRWSYGTAARRQCL